MRIPVSVINEWRRKEQEKRRREEEAQREERLPPPEPVRKGPKGYGEDEPERARIVIS